MKEKGKGREKERRKEKERKIEKERRKEKERKIEKERRKEKGRKIEKERRIEKEREKGRKIESPAVVIIDTNHQDRNLRYLIDLLNERERRRESWRRET